MSDPHAHDSAAVFSDEEIQRLHAEDLAAATKVVCLMCGIFCVGVVLYTIVAWACAT